MTGWKDIATAPKDGTRIDIWGDDRRVTNAFWKDEHWHVFSHGRGKVPVYHILSDLKATHWMAIPAAPCSFGERPE